MNFRLGGLILSTVALIGLASPSLAATLKPKHHKVAHVHHLVYARANDINARNDNYLFPGAVTQEGADNRYLTDTANPNQMQLFHGLMQISEPRQN